MESSRDPLAAGPVTRSGIVTRVDEPVLDLDTPPVVRPVDPKRRQRRMLLLYGGSAGLVALIGVIVLMINVLGSAENPFTRQTGPVEDLPPLARLCPPPTALPPPAPPQAPSTWDGPRTTDPQAGISYRRYDEPWAPWRETWTAGTLEVPYAVGQHFVTEMYGGGTYHASILSASVPAAVNDALTIDLECTGRQVASDVRSSYYPQPNTMDLMRDERATIGGRPAWVTKFRLHFQERGLKATSELVGVALIDVGRPEAAILYISIPGTHSQWDWVVDDALASVVTT